ncbi:anthranilate phosphoribosyltransferase family protein [Calothrix sp. NIES-3974]|uniref:anthranilate phosphoribosyltransferase family protein n=1 Tax=Calothrix sp. NIES-3974 TaxID=2005462 RepID=UPI000B6228AC|nr:anthranilate phosphoribosyltransferase family protein [Calothrix sp. NIES-3974]BAZ07127.1 hypothetical protein NIES3974_37900 [Calothrix sp. NIES-3974]
MSAVFRDLLRKVGSGNHTSQSLSRTEAAIAAKMMLLAEATPAQIGAFLIAHRIKRPTGEELAGMLDTFEGFGPKFQPVSSQRPVIVFGIPYDGRSRTAPISPITALLLASVEQPVIMHGGGRLPTKYGLPLIEIWQGLGVDWTRLSLTQNQNILEKVGIGFIYTPLHFPLTNHLWEYRDQLGKRPPLATMELIWCPYAGNAHQISGFVHPPTEGMFLEAWKLRGVQQFTTIKGLEGSVDLPCDRTAIIGLGNGNGEITRLHLSASQHGFKHQNVALTTTSEFIHNILELLDGRNNILTESAIWNGGFYLWRCGICEDITTGIQKAELLFSSGAVSNTLINLRNHCLPNNS